MKRLTTNIFLALACFCFGNSTVSAQMNIEVKDLFASQHLEKDSVYQLPKSVINSMSTKEKAAIGDSGTYEYLQMRISFIVNRPEQVARVNFKIGENIDTDEVFSGFATMEMRRGNMYSVFNGQSIKLLGDKVVINWTGDKKQFNNAKYVTLQVQANDGKVSNRVFTFIRYY